MKYLLILILTGLISCGSNNPEAPTPEKMEEHHDGDSNTVFITETQYTSAGITTGKPEKNRSAAPFVPTVYLMFLRNSR